MLAVGRILSLWLAAVLAGCSSPPDEALADRTVAQLRDTLSPMPMDETCAMGISAPNGSRGSEFVCSTAKGAELRGRVYREITAMGPAGAAALGRAYRSPDISVRRGAALALEWLGGNYSQYPQLSLESALPALKKGLDDQDELVRSWSAQALAHLGSRAAAAVPALKQMLSSPDEGERISACIGLGGIGPPARAAVPALRHALADPSRDVRGFAQTAILAIGD